MESFHFVNSFGRQNVFINLLTDIYQSLDVNHLSALDTPE